ncbi:decarboxylating dehydrogenases-isocitrate isopropylmalate tartrate [Holotrichia oblita]|uniref:Decarboxylating dehydrogenases-isocitrate isopropylmalate tartrate n=1 Tax=Holotrichia oblita TaxID=644536 RepID=A0ACB9TGX1_HOLOL|nr:decarboxylating dehydrogenases-isocitrate isopropylmalate tartrate [Holotrichia oblita]
MFISKLHDVAFVELIKNFLYQNISSKCVFTFSTKQVGPTLQHIDIRHPPLGDDDIPFQPYGGRYIVTMLPGNGVGPELMRHVEDVIQYINAPIDFEKITIRDGATLQSDLNNAVTSVKRNGIALKGTIEPNFNSAQYRNPNVEIRNNLDLFVNITFWKSRAGIKSKYQNIDIVLIRQNTEGEYAMLEHMCKPGVIECLKVVTQSNTERLAHWAFNYATRYRRRKVTVVHKANIMKMTDGLFLKTVKQVSKKYPHIQCNDVIIDNCSMQLITKPHQFDVILLPNLYGTVLNNVICGLTGGPGLTAGANYGHTYAIFEPACRNLGNSLVGQNSANPIAMLNATISLLFYLKKKWHAKMLKDAISKTLLVDNIFTPDLGGNHTTTDVVNKIKENVSLLYN